MSLQTFENLASFPGGIQAKPGDLELVVAPELPGRHAWKIRLTPQSTPLANPEQRVHCLTSEDINIGDTISLGAAYYLPTDRPAGKGWDSIFETHQGWHGPAASYGGPAPGDGYFTNDEIAIIARGGNVKPDSQGGGSFIQSQWGAKGDGHGYQGPFANSISSNVPKGRWFTLQVTKFLAVDSKGWLEAEIDFVEAVKRVNVPTCYPFKMFAIPVNGYRSHVNANNATHFMWAALGRGPDAAKEVREYLAAYVGHGGTPPSPAPSPAAAQAKIDAIKTSNPKIAAAIQAVLDYAEDTA